VSFRIIFALLLSCSFGWSQSISAGTVSGTVTDPSGAAIAGATATLHNPISNYQQAATTGQTGTFRFTNVPLNSYHLEVKSAGFATYGQDVRVQSTVPMNLAIRLVVAGAQTTIQVEATGSDILENVPTAHNDIDQSSLSKLPISSPGSGLSDAITLSAPGVVADSNGFFHPLGDHAQTSYYIDGQPISDQQSKAFSTQMPENAFQSLELITGSAPAQYGDKTSLVVDAVTRSGLGKPLFGSFDATYGSFGTMGEKAALGFGSAKLGNFMVFNADRSGRFLDSPEFHPMHDIGNNETFFDRLDFQPNSRDSLHLNLFGARNWFQIPNTYDQPGQDQRQKVDSFNIAPGYQHTFGPATLLTVNPWVRRDFVNYYPSRDPFQDLPATLSQDRHLFNYGVRADVSIATRRHNLKFGTEEKQTRLFEDFAMGITDPAFLADPATAPGLLPYDLTRGGSLFHFRAKGNINQYAVYAQDSVSLGNFSVNGGVRFDRYDGLSSGNGFEPRIGASYQIKKTGTVLRASYGRTFETPYNENLLLSSAAGVGGLASNVFGAFAVAPLKPGTRNQFNTGLQQAIGRYLLVDANYFWKYTNTAYDFDVLFNTPVTFPIAWRKSKLDGLGARVSTTSMKGFQAYLTLGHTRARFFGPETGGLIFNAPVDASVFRIDHDQALESTLNLRYQKKKDSPWIDFTWRYDSGLVAGNVPDLAAAMALTPAQQAAIGFNPATGTASRIRIPAAGTENDDTNPPRIAPHHMFDLSAGSDNVLHTEPAHMTLRFTILNLANEVALYNFLSTFSGTHFVTPRSFQVSVGVSF